MKKLTLSFIFNFILIAQLLSQSPEAFKYQAIVRSSDGQPIVNQEISVKVQIIKGSIYGGSVYVETHKAITNQEGLINLSIGLGIPELGVFSKIEWKKDNYFIEIDIDAQGGNNYIQMGIAQLLSVPYALHSKTAEKAYGFSETDPLFNASLAKKITETDTSYWNHKIDLEIDGSLTNELQVLSISNDTIYLSQGGFVVLPELGVKLPFEGSKLLTSEEQVMLNNWIGNPNQKWVLCYSKSTSLANSEVFNESCKYLGPSVTVIRLQNNRRFGGYTENSWAPNIGYRGYDNAFIFSIDNKKRYSVGYRYDCTSYSYPSFGPCFGAGHDICINSSLNIQYVYFPYSYSWNKIIGAPTNLASQELCGLNVMTPAIITELEVWVMK